MVKLRSIAPPAYSDEYTYNTIGNLTSKTGVGAYTYAATATGCAAGTPATKPHAVSQAGSTPYAYDCNGNLTSGAGRIITWDFENRPSTISHVSGNETYAYDADGERVKKVKGSTTTYYLGGLWEEDSTGATKAYYSFNGQVVAMRQSSGVTYLHGDHLGSVSVSTNSSGALVSQQTFDPWGKVRSGSIAQTDLNYTGQRLDATGLLYYHARMYDPVLGRFASADSVVPGDASGGMEGIALRPLTVDFHEPGFASGLNRENGQPFWFQMDGKQRQKAGSPWGPANPQALNRYSYVLNNPLRYVDPTGHYLPPDKYYMVQQDYETVAVPEAQRGSTFYDRDGNKVYADKDTGVLYRINERGEKERLYRASSAGPGCGPSHCYHKYVYENDAGFQAYKRALYIYAHTSDSPSGGSVAGFIASCALGKSPAGCFLGAVLLIAGADIDAGITRSDAMFQAHEIFPQMHDSGKPMEPYGPPRPPITILR